MYHSRPPLRCTHGSLQFVCRFPGPDRQKLLSSMVYNLPRIKPECITSSTSGPEYIVSDAWNATRLQLRTTDNVYLAFFAPNRSDHCQERRVKTSMRKLLTLCCIYRPSVSPLLSAHLAISYNSYSRIVNTGCSLELQCRRVLPRAALVQLRTCQENSFTS